MKKDYPFLSFLLTVLLFTGSLPLHAQQLAFPGAEGFGRFTSGGRGGVVYEVTNLNNAGPGSLRHGVEMSGPRTIVFRVSGNIHLDTDLRIRNGDLTIAGQTAPGEGITIKGSGMVIDADNIIIRYMRFRPGDELGRELDALWGRQNKNIIIDHCSLSWGTDEVGSFYDNENFTMQWCILSESLYESVHGKGRHGYGGIWGGQGATFHHNLLAHHSSRNPRFNGARYTTTPETELVDFRNNVIFNWGGNSAYGGEGGKHNLVANYYKPGPATSGDKRFRIINPSYDSSLPWSKWYIADNFVEGYPEVSADNWNGGVQGVSTANLPLIRVDEPFPHAPVETQTAQAAYLSVLADAGATFPYRDPIDARIAEEVRTGTATYGGVYGAKKGIIDTQTTVGGWPELFSAPRPADSDKDGMPDEWELALGLNPTDAADRNGDLDGDGYTNLENYLNSLPGTEQANFLKYPTALAAEAITTSSLSLSWKDNAEQETEIILERSAADQNNYTVLATLAPNTTTYVDEGLQQGTLYYYRLKVRNGEEQSAYSTPLAVQTLFEPMAPDQQKLVGYWSFNDNAGMDVKDLSQYNQDGELKNAAGTSWVTGKTSKALNFSRAAATTHVLVPAATQLNFDVNSFSISLWMKWDAETNQAYLLHKGSFVQDATAGTSGKWWGIELKDGLIRFAVDDNVTKSEVSASSAGLLGGEWVHVVAIRDRQRDVLSLYQNGVLLAEATDNTNGGLRQSEPLYIANSRDLNTPFTGVLDELKVYNYSLSQAEVAGIYKGIPMVPFKPSPADAATDVVPEEVVLQWSGDAAAYDLYFGTTADKLELLATDLTDPLHTLTGLDPASQYFWRVKAKGGDDLVSEGPVWTYTTGAPTGLDDIRWVESLKVYPNPFSDQLNIAFELKKGGQVTLLIYDMQNRLISAEALGEMPVGVQQIRLGAGDLRMLSLREGVYLCVLQTADAKIVRRIVYLKE